MYSEIIMLFPALNCKRDCYDSALSSAQASDDKLNNQLPAVMHSSADAEAGKGGHSTFSLSINEESPIIMLLHFY